MEDTLTLREIAPPKPATPLPATLKETALASFVPIEAHMRTLAARYKDVAYDVGTPKGMADARAARLVLREEGRYAVQRLQERLKKEANDLKRTLDAKGDELIALVKPAEDAIHAQIEAEEDRKAAAKAEAERVERERVAALEARIAGLSVWIDRCRVPGITSERIGKGIAMLEQAPIDDTWADFKALAIERRAEILGVMQSLYQQHLISEVEARRLEEQRAEAARIEAALAARKAELDAQAAELLRRTEELAREEAERLERIDRERRQQAEDAALDAEFDAINAAFDRAWDRCGAEHTYALRDAYIALDPAGKDVPRDKWAEYTAALDALQPADALPKVAVGGPEVDMPPPPEVESDSTLPAVVEPATLKIGAICTRFEISITAAFLHGKGIESAGRDKAAVLYRESQWPVIKAALIRHIEAA